MGTSKDDQNSMFLKNHQNIIDTSLQIQRRLFK